MTAVFMMMTLQALLGAVDNFWHHEIIERLPVKRSATLELALHAGRESLYAFIFIGLAWWRWQGGYVLLFAAVMALEILLTVADFVIEDRTRRLPAFERVLHTLLALNYGATLAVLTPLLWACWHLPTSVEMERHGVFSGLFTLFGAGVFVWAVRNARAALRLSRPAEWVRHPIRAATIRTGRTVLVSGATGFIGGHLVRRLINRGDTVMVLTRDADKALDRFGPHVRVITDLAAIPDDDSIDAIVNLAGEPILRLPWTRKRRALLLRSRVETTRGLVALMARLVSPIRVLVTASAIGYYGVHAEEDIDEHCGPGPEFQSTLCHEWEMAALGGAGFAARIVRIRIGLVLSNDGGALPGMATPHRFGLGAILGSGRQWISWIHIDDLIGLVEFALDKPAARGILNGVAPTPVTHRDFQSAIARTLHRPLWLKISARLIRYALGEMSELLIGGQRVLPNRPVALGYRYKYVGIEKALKSLLDPQIHLDITVKYVDALQSPAALSDYGLRREHLERRVYVRDADGRLLSGMPALIVIWSRLRGYRLLARVCSLPLVRAFAELAYDRLVAPGLAAWTKWRRDAAARAPFSHRS